MRGQLEQARLASAAGPAATAAATAKDLLRKLDKAESIEEKSRLRLRIAAAIKRLVDTIWIWVGDRKVPREAVMQVVFKDGTCRMVRMWADGRAVTHDAPYPLMACGTLGPNGLSGMADVVFTPAAC